MLKANQNRQKSTPMTPADYWVAQPQTVATAIAASLDRKDDKGEKTEREWSRINTLVKVFRTGECDKKKVDKYHQAFWDDVPSEADLMLAEELNKKFHQMRRLV